MDTGDFLIEEYKQVRGEIIDRERAITQLFVVAVVASVSILSAVGAIVFKIEPAVWSNLSEAYAYPFLGPLTIIIPILYVFVSHRRDLHKCGTYLHVYFEDKGLGPMWETRLIKYRKLKKGESLDVLPWTFWMIFLISVAGFVFTLYKIIGFNCVTEWIIPLVLIAVAFIFMFVGHFRFCHASVNIRHEQYILWKSVDKSDTCNDSGDAT